MDYFKSSTSLLGDALEILGSFPDHIFDHAIIDPPYNMSKKKGLRWAFSSHVTMQESWDVFSKEQYFLFCRDWLRQICRVVKPNGNLIIFGTFHNIYLLGFLLQGLDRRILNSIIWSKPNAQPNITCRMLTESTEQIIWACNAPDKKAKAWTFDYQKSKQYNEGKQLRNIWSFPVTPPSEKTVKHPNQKPEALIERIIHLFTKESDWILDPFAGSGTLGKVAGGLNRNFVLIESSKRYFESQKTRFDKAGLNKILFKPDASGRIETTGNNEEKDSNHGLEV